MAELTIDPASIRKALDDFVSSYKPSDTPTQEVGYVATAGDGIAHVTGLPGCMANELLTFEDGTLGLAFNLDAREIGVVILGDFAGIEQIFYRLCSSHCPIRSWRIVRDGVPASGHRGRPAAHGQQ